MGIETLAAVSIGSAIAGTAVSAAGANAKAEGAQAQANAEASAYNYKAQVAQNNAIIARRNADNATHAGLSGASTNDMNTRTKLGSAIVTQAANGLDVGSGTNTNIQDSIRDLGHLDTLTILNNAAKQTAGFKAQGMNFEAEAGLDTASSQNAKAAGDYARIAGDYDVATSVLGGVSSVSNKWLSFTQKGIIS